jgi:hypothetical protein
MFCPSKPPELGECFSGHQINNGRTSAGSGFGKLSADSNGHQWRIRLQDSGVSGNFDGFFVFRIPYSVAMAESIGRGD